MQMRETDKELILLSAVCRLYQIPNYLLIPFSAPWLHYIKHFSSASLLHCKCFKIKLYIKVLRNLNVAWPHCSRMKHLL